MQPHEKEEVWLARIVMILGVSEIVDVLLNLATILKIRSGLPIAVSTADERTAVAYLVSSAITGVYLVSGGRLLSVMAYGRPVPREHLYGSMDLPDWRQGFRVAFRAFGARQMILTVGSVALAIAYYQRPIDAMSASRHRPEVIEIAWALEHALVGFVLLSLGGKLADFFTGGPRTPKPPQDASAPRS